MKNLIKFIKKEHLDDLIGFGYQYYYYIDTVDLVEIPSIVYDGSSFTAPPGWTAIIPPNAPKGANVFVAPVRYQIGMPGETVEGVVLFGTIPGHPPKPVEPKKKTYENGIVYGLANDTDNPVGGSYNSAAFSLLVNQTHETAVLNMPTTTNSAQKWYITLPEGLALVSAVDSVQGDITSEFIKDDAVNRYIYTIGFESAQANIRFTVRRDS